jgi:acyl dehydratase
MGLVRFGDVVLAQDDEVVMTQTHLVMMLRRGAQERPRDVAPRPPPAPGTAAPQEEALGRETPPSFEMLTAGMSYALGRDHVDRDSVVRFAKAYDPQPFHVDEEAAKRSHFGGLAASGWQTATGWSKAAYAHHRRTYGTAEPRRGQMLGLTALNWRQPVYPGDTISYAMRIESKRPSEQPGFGLVETYNTGTSQDGTLVIDFRGTSLWGMEP